MPVLQRFGIRNLLQTRFLHLRLRQQNSLLERLYAETRAALQVQNETLAAITHDLGQPLTSIRVLAESLRRQAGSDDAATAVRLAEGLTGIAAATSTMWAMVSELLDLARLDAGRLLELDWQQVDLVELVQRAVAAQTGVSERHTIRVQTQAPQLPIDVDPGRIERVLGNLLANALKFSPAGDEITVTVASEAQDGAGSGGEAEVGDWAVVRVQDQGVGIPAADLPYVFERFHRGSNVAGRISGTGIGLAGAYQIVAQHDGRIEIQREEGHGATFTVRLSLH